jgi:hypothetical protein
MAKNSFMCPCGWSISRGAGKTGLASHLVKTKADPGGVSRFMYAEAKRLHAAGTGIPGSVAPCDEMTAILKRGKTALAKGRKKSGKRRGANRG